MDKKQKTPQGNSCTSHNITSSTPHPATMTTEELSERLEAFIQSQPEIRGRVVVMGLKPPGTGGGASSGTYVFECELDLGEGQCSRRFFLRYRLDDSFFPKEHYDFGAQFNVQKALQGSGVPVPKPLWVDLAGKFLGVPSLITEYVDGLVPTSLQFTHGLLADADPADRRPMISSVIQNVCKIHAVDWQQRGLGFLRNRGRGKSLIERDMSWYWDVLKFARPDAQEKYLPIWKWLVDHQPAIENPVLNHGDCHCGNYMFRDTQVVAVLDWEMCCLGAREMDLAYLCTISELMQVGNLRLPYPEDWLPEYEKASGYTIQNWVYYRTLMFYRCAIIGHASVRRLSPDQRDSEWARMGWFEARLMDRMKELAG